jgi:hypothetical protein
MAEYGQQQAMYSSRGQGLDREGANLLRFCLSRRGRGGLVSRPGGRIRVSRLVYGDRSPQINLFCCFPLIPVCRLPCRIYSTVPVRLTAVAHVQDDPRMRGHVGGELHPSVIHGAPPSSSSPVRCLSAPRPVAANRLTASLVRSRMGRSSRRCSRSTHGVQMIFQGC